jgi:hypothetical protein
VDARQRFTVCRVDDVEGLPKGQRRHPIARYEQSLLTISSSIIFPLDQRITQSHSPGDPKPPPPLRKPGE